MWALKNVTCLIRLAFELVNKSVAISAEGEFMIRKQCVYTCACVCVRVLVCVYVCVYVGVCVYACVCLPRQRVIERVHEFHGGFRGLFNSYARV